VRLEIGPLGSWVPSKVHSIKPYAAEILPNLFDDPSCAVLTIVAERTFWEKATILHQEAHRKSVMPQRHSRHYYDLYKLALSPVRKEALSALPLLAEVVQFKQRFYPSQWARYDLYKLALSPVRKEALSALPLLAEVVQFKQRFYPSQWARYDLAQPGTFRLLPVSDAHRSALELDYEQMQVMLFGDRPQFPSILNGLEELEAEINSL
jgi:hypothetical protein